ncbi:uncharacterized protein LY79DRAFT_143600 [Colletotrichum navitas]|uniref:Uncharacterized protein n=1 Tax=Colletotrichum navitas TaxID=681940 RepID=A0AAD8QEB9_9PEZI|nr:uncharacterized protein LY79DRAFT_143600 [Colletotrichum navitas]KAK1599534.1 hypothetical protein LY79DRAFT_143600 [Colletotrichum navitas]
MAPSPPVSTLSVAAHTSDERQGGAARSRGRDWPKDLWNQASLRRASSLTMFLGRAWRLQGVKKHPFYRVPSLQGRGLQSTRKNVYRTALHAHSAAAAAAAAAADASLIVRVESTLQLRIEPGLNGSVVMSGWRHGSNVGLGLVQGDEEKSASGRYGGAKTMESARQSTSSRRRDSCVP